MKKTSLFTRTIYIAVVVMLLAACATPATSAAATSARGNQRPSRHQRAGANRRSRSQGPQGIVIGAALPLTGGQAREGAFYKKSWMIVKEWNDAGGITVKEFNRKIGEADHLRR